MVLGIFLPDGWMWTPFNNIGQFLRGVSYRKENSSEEPKKGWVPILRATNIQDDNLILDRDLVYVPSECVRSEQYLKQGDIVVCMSSGSKNLVGKTAQLSKAWKGSFGTFCAAIRPFPTVNVRLVGYYFSSSSYRRFIQKKSVGININNLKPIDFELLEIPLPPLPEEERIVERIESLFTQLDAGVAGLKRLKEVLRRYKASVLKAACEGRLVLQDPSDEPAEKLLKQSGKVPLESDDLPKLPKGWCWGTISDIASSIQYGYTQSASNIPNGPKFLRITDIQNGYVNWEIVPYCEINDSEIEKYLLEQGDIVFTRTGATTGKSYLIGKCPRAIFASYLIRLRLLNKYIIKYFYIFLDSPLYWSQIMSARKGSAQPGVNATILSTLKVPIPPFCEQKRIVVKVEQHLSVVQELEHTIEANLKRAVRLRQAIIKRAFEGKLI